MMMLGVALFCIAQGFKIRFGGSYEADVFEDKSPLGEDSFLTNEYGFVVTDGVGGTKSQGIDSGNFSRLLTMVVDNEMKVQRKKNIQDVLMSAIKKTEFICTKLAVKVQEEYQEKFKGITGTLKRWADFEPLHHKSRSANQKLVQGASTVIAARVKGQYLTTASIGDSQLIVIREGKVVFRTETGQHFFNSPYCVSLLFYDVYSHTKIRVEKEAIHLSRMIKISKPFHLRNGDLIVGGSDGLFDNLWDEEIIQFMEEHHSAIISGEEELSNIADRLVKKSRSRQLTLKEPSNPPAKTDFVPFYHELVKAHPSEKKLTQGKPDDTTVVLGVVSEE